MQTDGRLWKVNSSLTRARAGKELLTRGALSIRPLTFQDSAAPTLSIAGTGKNYRLCNTFGCAYLRIV